MSGEKSTGANPASAGGTGTGRPTLRQAQAHAYWCASRRVHGRIADDELGFETAARHLVSAVRNRSWDRLRCAAGATVASLGLEARLRAKGGE